ncbi:MAG TPA: type II toxin-antitoxin system HicB family antitoxin [Burkholderiales bacterium]|nr:type II toxin-antitoxin system HicB family antitoxin [Burkholderiales bacterium]
MHFSIVHEQAQDGRWTAQVPEFPKLLAYGKTKEEATEKAEILALLALAEKRFRLGRA